MVAPRQRGTSPALPSPWCCEEPTRTGGLCRWRPCRHPAAGGVTAVRRVVVASFDRVRVTLPMTSVGVGRRVEFEADAGSVAPCDMGGVRGDDGVPAADGLLDDGYVDDVVVVARAARAPTLRAWSSERPSMWQPLRNRERRPGDRLASLGQDTRRDHRGEPAGESCPVQGPREPVVAFRCDERSGVVGEALRSPLRPGARAPQEAVQQRFKHREARHVLYRDR